MSEFDSFAHNYEKVLKQKSRFLGDICHYSKYKLQISKSYFGDGKINILEFGVGVGVNIPNIASFFPNASIFGCDPSQISTTVALRNNPTLTIVDNVEDMAYREKFDAIFIANVFHHIPQKERVKAVTQVYNLLAKDGIVIIFEHNPFNPLTQYIVKTTPCDKNAQLLYKKELVSLFFTKPFTLIESKYTLFFPPMFPNINRLNNYLGWLPFGGQYFVVLTKL